SFVHLRTSCLFHDDQKTGDFHEIYLPGSFFAARRFLLFCAKTSMKSCPSQKLHPSKSRV
ncbi:MAG: hypothetical protein KJ950_16355, partial [Proteobacteria bacterium]|nr:hypothetical protein [Pseudomonadota bacterium]MBU1686136.1 hypothetical protein [Pseudomonadota bacterium]